MEERETGLSEKGEEQQAELQSLLLQLRQYQVQIEQKTQELLFIRQALNDHDKAIETVKELKKMKAGDELIVPIGANSSVYATLSMTDKIIVRIGGGVSVERDPDYSITYLSAMKNELENTERETTSVLQKMEREAQGLQGRLRELTSKSEGQRQT